MGLGGLGVPGILVIGLILLVFFGRGRIPQLMGDVAKGVTAFRKGLKDDGEADAENADSDGEGAKVIEAKAEETAAEAVEKTKADV